MTVTAKVDWNKANLNSKPEFATTRAPGASIFIGSGHYAFWVDHFRNAVKFQVKTTL